MNRLNRIFNAFAICTAAITLHVRAQTPEPKGPPNIIYIMADDHAAHAISAYGSKINQTPNIDRLAREGVRFTNCFCENSLCSPSRAAIITGSFSCRNGVPDLSTKLDPAKVTCPPLLHEKGYQTALIGKWHLHRNPAEFDHWDMLPEQGVYHDPVFLSPGERTKVPGYVTDIITDKCIQWLEQRDKTKPFMLMCLHKAPHRPWEPDAKHAHMYDNVDIPEPETFNDDYATRSDAARQQKMAIDDLTATDVKETPPEGLTPAQLKHWRYERFIKDYLACIASVDDSVGKLLDYLDKNGLAENTIVIYTSDQGFYLGDHGWFDKRWMYEESLRMPLIVRYPGHFKPGSVCESFVQNIDFAPTMLDYGGASVPAVMQGLSMRGQLEGTAKQPLRTSVFYHYYEEGTEHHVAAHYGVRTDRYKLIRFYSQVKAWELYDLKEDPHELHNVYENPKYASVVADLKGQLEKLKGQYGDTTETDAPAEPTSKP